MTKKAPKKITQSYLENSSLYYLQNHAASVEHFREVMRRKVQRSIAHHKEPDIESCEKILDEITQKYIEYGYLDDTAYAKALVQSLNMRGLPARRISAKLREKRVDKDTAHAAMENAGLFNDESQMAAALTFIRRKKLGSFALNDKKPYEKQLASMARAGFSYDIAKKALESDE